jgi:hypothetical protein
MHVIAAALVATPNAGTGAVRVAVEDLAVGAHVDEIPLFSLRENAIVKEPGLSYPER